MDENSTNPFILWLCIGIDHPMGNSPQISHTNKETVDEIVEKIEEKVEIGHHPTLDEKSELVSDEILKKLYELAPVESRSETMVLMYSSKKHGLNINFFHDRVCGRGPTFLLIRGTKSSHVFGCFASTNWSQQPDFYGDNNCFLFSFSEKLYVYRPGTYNSNFQCFNHDSKYNKYNGLGMGGQIGFFSLSLNDDFNKGKSNPETMTFPNAPCLSHPSSCTDTPLMEGVNVNFDVDLIEVIGFPLTHKDGLNLEYEKQLKDGRRDPDDEGVDRMILEAGGVKKEVNRGGAF